MRVLTKIEETRNDLNGYVKTAQFSVQIVPFFIFYKINQFKNIPNAKKCLP
jgi:hypothetical protein